MLDAFSAARRLALACLLALAGCGGGGSGGGATATGPVASDPPTTTSNGVSITVDKTELRFVGLGGYLTPGTSMNFSISGPQAAGTYYAAVQPDANAIFDTYVTNSSLTSMQVAMTAHTSAPSADGTIMFKLCKDQNCASVVWSRSIPYHIRNYTLDTSDLQLMGFEGGNTSTTHAMSPATASAASDLKVEATTVNGGDWLGARIDGNGLVLDVKGAGMSQGSYMGSVAISVPGNALSGMRIPVAMTLGAGFALPAEKNLVIDMASPAVVSGSIALGFNGVQSPAWKAVSDKPWLQLQTGAGSGAGAVGYTIDTARLAGLANFTSDKASVTFSAAGMRDAVYTVSVAKKLPEIIAMTPNPVPAGQAVDLRLLGRGLRQLAGISAIRIDNNQLANGTILSDTEAVIKLPALAAGAHSVAIPVASGPGMAQPVLNVVNKPTMAAALIDSAGTKTELVFSAARSAFYTVDRGNGKLLRYTLYGGNWIMDKSTPVDNMTRIGLSPDGATLYTTAAAHLLEERNPDTLEVRATYTDNNPEYFLTDYYGKQLPVTQDGRIWFVRDQWTDLRYFDTLTKRFGSANVQGAMLWNATYAVSADGSRMVVNSVQSVGQIGTLRYDSATSAFDLVANIPDYGNIGTVLSGNGNYVLFGATKLYETSTGRLVGQLPEGTGGYYRPALLSSDGSRIYAGAYTETSMSLAYVRLDVIDTASMAKIGEIPLPEGVVDCGSSMNCDMRGVFVMSPFGDTIFWAGNKKIAVIPIPAALKPPVGVARFKLVQ